MRLGALPHAELVLGAPGALPRTRPCASGKGSARRPAVFRKAWRGRHALPLWTIWTEWTIWTGRPQGSPLQALRKHPRGQSAPALVPLEASEGTERTRSQCTIHNAQFSPEGAERTRLYASARDNAEAYSTWTLDIPCWILDIPPRAQSAPTLMPRDGRMR